MADTSGQAEIRGIQIEKAAKGFADEELIFKRFVTVSNTSAREIRWYQKTAGFLTASDPESVENVGELALPTVLEQSWTRNTSYVRKYFVESPTISDEDIKDSDIDVLMTNIRDLVRAVAYKVDGRIWDVMTESQSPNDINTNASTAAWDAGSGQDPIEDILEAKQNIREDGYNVDMGGVLFLSAKDHKNLMSWLISEKGNYIPGYASSKITSGVVQEFLGLRVVVSENVTADYACVAIPSRAVTWKTFTSLTGVTIADAGIGQKIRVWEEGEAILTDPKAVNLITNTQS